MPARLDLNHKYFRSISSSSNGEVNSETVFHYRQKGQVIWATYKGGDILFGVLSGYVKNGKLIFNYQHQNNKKEILTGKCESMPEIRDGVIRLHEKWQWTCGDYSTGESILEEVKNSTR